MSRTTLSVVTAVLLAAGSVALMAARRRALGDELYLPGDSAVWKVTMLVSGRSAGDARLTTAAPLDVGRQHVLRESGRSDEFDLKPAESKSADPQRLLGWAQKPGLPSGSFRARYECYCSVRADGVAPAAAERTRLLYAAPKPGEHLRSEPGLDADHPDVAALARRLADGLADAGDRAAALYRHVEQELAAEPSLPGPARSAADCLRAGGGDAAAKARLLAALCRNRGVPARLVTGIALVRDDQPSAHVWVEAFVRDHWLPMDPFYGHYGRLPRAYLVLGYGELRPAHGRNVRGLEWSFLVERGRAAGAGTAAPGRRTRLFRAVSLAHLPLPEQHLAEFLLLLPVAALIICVFRNLIGLTSFGTFTPALVGLAFRDLRSWPGVLVFVAIVLAGWLLRRALNRFHLLQVPRISLMLSLVISMLVVFVVVSNRLHWPATAYISLFPLIILTSMIERFWTLEEEDGTRASFRTLLTTLAIAGCISLLISRPPVAQHLLRYPETIGVVMAAMLLLGRYTGYRLTELYRFRDFTRQRPADDVPGVVVFSGRAEFGSNRF